MNAIETKSKGISTCFEINNRSLTMGIEGIYKNKGNKKSFSFHSGYTSMFISVIILFASFFIVFSFQYLHVMKVYGEASELTDSNHNGLAPNDSGTSISYERLLENNYPFPVQHVSRIIGAPILVFEGTVISKNTSNDLVPLSKLTRGGGISLGKHQVPNKNIFFNSLEGKSPNGTSFGTDVLNYTGRYLSLNFGSIEKTPESNQITFNFHIHGKKGTYKLTLINGESYSNGWINNTFYQNIPQGSSRLIDLVEMASSVGDEFTYLDRIQINIEKGTQIDLLTFRIEFGKTTINTPGVINEDISYLVNGLVFKDKINSIKYYYLLQDWDLKQILNQEFVIESSDDFIIESNGWKINQMDEFKDNKTGKTIITIKSERNVKSKQISFPEILQHFSIYHSLMSVGSPKDILFIAVFAFVIFLFYPKFSGSRKSEPKNRKYTL